MAEINELVARLRGAYSTVFERSLAKEAADLIESQERDKAALAARIAELEGTIARHDHAKGEAMSRMERTLASVQTQIQWMKDNPNVGVAEVFKRLLDAMTDDMVAIEQDLAAANAELITLRAAHRRSVEASDFRERDNEAALAAANARAEHASRAIDLAARAMRGEGVEDQGQAWDMCLRILDAAIAAKEKQ